MVILSKLTPAETYLIMKGSQASFKDLLKYTLLDLLLKKVLKSEEHEHQSHPSNPIRIINYLQTGSNFSTYSSKPHEQAFLKPFSNSEDLEIMFRHLVKLSYENAGSKKRYVFDCLLNNSITGDCFNNGFLNRLFDSIALTDKGKDIKTEIEQALNKLENELPNLINSNPETALKILNKINGNVFLLKSFDFELLKKIDDEFAKEIQKRNEDTSYGCTGCFIYFDSYSDSFDSGFDSADGGSSGCGGTSGCSGCSGCGGCGGCGS